MLLNESNAFIFDFLKQNFDFGGKKESKSKQNINFSVPPFRMPCNL